MMNPQIPAAQPLNDLIALVTVLADKGAPKMLESLKEATDAYRVQAADAGAKLKALGAAQAKLDADREAVAKEAAAAKAELDRAAEATAAGSKMVKESRLLLEDAMKQKAELDAQVAEKVSELAARERAVSAREAEAAKALTDATALKEKYQGKIADLRAAVA